ncbi:MAG: hypothetical protein ACOY0T_28895 [Myxococcota bacterium]
MHRYSQKSATLVETIDRGDSLLLVAPGGWHFGLLPYKGPIEIRSIMRTQDGVATLSSRSVPLPNHWGIAALAPSGQLVAIVTGPDCSLIDASGTRVGGCALSKNWGQCAAVSFSASGATLWLSFEGAGDNRVAAVDVATSTLLGMLSIPSESTTSHLHRVHPRDEVLLMESSATDTDLSLVRRDGNTIVLVAHKGYAAGVVALGMDATGASYRTERGVLTRALPGGFTMDKQTFSRPEWMDEDVEPQIAFTGIGSMLGNGALTLMTYDVDPNEPQEFWHRLYDEALDPVLEMEIELDADGERCRRQDGLAEDLVILTYENEYVVLDWGPWLRVPEPTATNVPLATDGVFVSDPTHHPEASSEDSAILRLWMIVYPSGEVRCTARPQDEELTRSDVEKKAEWRGPLRTGADGKLEIALRSAWGTRGLQGRNDADGLVLAQVGPPPLDVYRFEHRKD